MNPTSDNTLMIGDAILMADPYGETLLWQFATFMLCVIVVMLLLTMWRRRRP